MDGDCFLLMRGNRYDALITF